MIAVSTGLVAVNFLLLLALFTLPEGFGREGLVYGLILFSFPHFMTTYAVWLKRVRSWRDEIGAILFPFLYVLVFILSTKGLVGPVHPFHLIQWTYLYLIYHFCGQLYGVGLWFCGEGRVQLGRPVKLFYRASFLLMGLFALLDFEKRGGGKILFYVELPVVPVPLWLWKSSLLLALGAVVVMTLLTCWQYVRTKNIREFLPLVMLLVGCLWFLPPGSEKLVLFLPVLHGLQYIPFIYLKHKDAGLYRLGLLACVSIALGYVCFRVLPFWGQGLRGMGALWSAMILTLLNNHHFIIDGRIWKLSDPLNKDLTSAPALQSPAQQDPA